MAATIRDKKNNVALSPGKYDFMGHLPVPLKYTFKEGLERIQKKYFERTGKTLNCYFPMGGSGNEPFKILGRAKSANDLPGIVLSSAFDGLFGKKFLEKFADSGEFRSCQKTPLPPIYADCGIKDPRNFFTVFSVAPIVILADIGKLKNLPRPRRWADLLNPIYRKKIIFGGWRKEGQKKFSEFNNFLLLNLYKDYGAESLKSLAQNTRNLLHYVYMSRIAGTAESEAAIYIMPWFLAGICPRRGKTEIIWPEDGALAFPTYLLIRNTESKRLGVLTRYLGGKKLGQYLNDNRYPSLNPDARSPYPPGAKLKWIGWDYVYSNNVLKLMETASKIFFNHWRDPSPAKTKK